MWISDYISRNKQQPRADHGVVSKPGSGSVSVRTFAEMRDLPMVAPYGVAYCPPQNKRAVVMPLTDGQACVGVLAEHKELAPGELLLFSSGGAYIHLRGDGKVIINGKEIG